MRFFSTVFSVVGLGVLTCASVLGGCGEPDPVDVDAGRADAEIERDSGPPPVDSGSGSDAGHDAGPSCTTGCSFVELALGSQFTCARRENGSVMCWGRGMEGQLGDSNETHSPRCPIAMADFRDCSARPVSVALEGPVTGLSAGAFSACAIDGMDDVQCWGQEGWPIDGVLAEVRYEPEAFPTLDDAALVSDGSILLCTVDNAGALECAGLNFARQTGTGMLISEVTLPAPVLVPGSLKSDPMPLTGVLEVRTGTSGAPFACARTATDVYCWGSDSVGQLGTGLDYETCRNPSSFEMFDCTEYAHSLSGLDGSMVTQLALGGSHACALLSDGTVQCWGNNVARQLGVDDVEERATPLAVPGLTGVTQITAGSSHTCALLGSGEVRCWGYNRFGQLGDGLMSHGGASCTLSTTNTGDCTPTAVAVSVIDDATYIEAGSNHTCAIRASGAEVWCWGSNDMLQLGNGPTRTPTGEELAPVFEPVMVNGL
ncbi:MAG: hypothetical protein M3Y87_35670 [Myxococcota bacterium]|nr:hypothetical protein [Myxococcota bacterium]